MARKAGGGRFEGFPREAFDFFEELALHNHRDWFHARREVYDRACREPMLRLVAELGGTRATTKVSRINKDMRFSRDKLLRIKDIFAGRTFAPAAWLSTRRALVRIQPAVKHLRPLAEWLRVQVGARR